MTRDRARVAKKPRSRLVRLIRFASLGTVSLIVLYLVAANVFLSTALFDKVINGSTDSVHIQFERAWSLFPQHVRAKKLSIRGHDSSLEWLVTLDDVELDISFAGLLKRKFQGSHVRAEGVSFRMRSRPEVAPSAEELSSLPSIPGFPPYSVRPPKPPESKTPGPAKDDDSTYRLWTLDLEDVVAKDVREVWIDRTRFEGRAQVAGRFVLKPVRAVEVGPLHIVAERGQISAGERRVAEAFDKSTVDVTITRFDPRTATGADIMHGLTLVADAHATLPGPTPKPLSAGTTLEGPLEVQRAVVRVTRGQLEKDSHFAAVAPGAVVTAGEYRVGANVALAADVTRGPDERDRLAFRAEFTKADASRRTSSSVLRAPTATVAGDATALDLSRPLEDLHALVDIPEIDLGNASMLSSYIPAETPASILNGGAKAEVHLEAWRAERRATVRAALTSDDLDFRLAKMRVRGRAAVHVNVAAYHFDTRHLEDVALSIRMANGSLASSNAPNTPLVRVNAAQLSAVARRVELADPLRDLAVSISLPSADVVAQGLLRAYLPKGSEMQIATSHSRFSLNINVGITNHLARGSFELQAKALATEYRDFRLDARVQVRARVHDWRWEVGELVLDDARVELDDVKMGKTAAATPGLAIKQIGLTAASTHFRFKDPLSKLKLSAFLVDARVRDFSTINSFLPNEATFHFDGNEGAFGARADLDVEEHIAKGLVRVRASSLGVGGETVHLRGDIDVVAEFTDWNFKNHTINLGDAHVEMTHVAGRFGADEGATDLSVGRILLAGQSHSFDLARPTLKGAEFRLIIKDGLLPDARALAPLLTPNGLFEIESGSGRVAADITISHARQAAQGNLELALNKASVRMRDMHLSGDFRFVARLSGFDPSRRLVDISGTRLEMRNVAVTGSNANTSGWRGDIALENASLQLKPGLTLDTVVRIEARDVTPILAIVAEKDLPKTVLRLTDVPHLSASAHVIAASHELALLDFDARGGNLALHGSYAVRGEERRGGLIFSKAFVSVGFGRDGRGPHLRFFRLKSWLRARSCAANALAGLKVCDLR